MVQTISSLFVSGIITVASMIGIQLSTNNVSQNSPQVLQAQSVPKCGDQDTMNWCQLNRTPDRKGYVPVTLGTTITAKGRREFYPDRLATMAQPVVVDGLIYFGTLSKTFYALRLNTTNNQLETKWVFTADGPIVGTAAFIPDTPDQAQTSGKIVFATLTGTVYALQVDANTTTPSVAWTFSSKSRVGFSSAILVVNDTIYLPDREGRYYALDKNGNSLWETQLTDPTGYPVSVNMSSAYGNGTIYVGGMDMRVYALDIATGTIVWRSPQLEGTAFRDYWPVVVGNYVVIRPYPSTREKLTEQLTIGQPPSQTIQDTMVSKFSGAQKRLQTLFILNQADGAEAFVAPHWTGNTHNGPVIPVGVDKNNNLIIPVSYFKPDGNWGGTGWGKLDLQQQYITELLISSQTYQSGGRYAGTGNEDETLHVSTTDNLIFTVHVMEGNAHYTGFWDDVNKQWYSFGFYGLNSYFWNGVTEPVGTPMVITTDVQGGSTGKLYHTSQNNINLRTIN